MSWTECSRIDVRKSLIVIISAILLVIVSVLACYWICDHSGLDKTTSVIACGTTLLLEFLLFNMIQDYKSDSLYFKNDDDGETYTIRTTKKGGM